MMMIQAIKQLQLIVQQSSVVHSMCELAISPAFAQASKQFDANRPSAVILLHIHTYITFLTLRFQSRLCSQYLEAFNHQMRDRTQSRELIKSPALFEHKGTTCDVRANWLLDKPIKPFSIQQCIDHFHATSSLSKI